MASIRERIDSNGKRTHQAQVRIKGHPPQTKTFVSKTDARRWAHQTEADIMSGLHIRRTESNIRTIGNLIDEYSQHVLPTKRRDNGKSRAALDYWQRSLGAYSLASITPKIIETYRDRLSREEIGMGRLRAPGTVLRYMMVLSHVFAKAVNWQWCERNPVGAATKPTVNSKRVRFLDEDERERLLAACKNSSNHDLHLAVVVAISTGMRKAEIMGMRWEAITFFAERNIAKLLLRAESTKNNSQRSVLIASHAYQLLRERYNCRLESGGGAPPEGLIFSRRSDSQAPVDLRAPWLSAIKFAGILNFRFHDLRHTTASYMAMNGATTLEIKEALGHKSTAMAERYSHLSQTHVDGVVRRMNERYFGS